MFSRFPDPRRAFDGGGVCLRKPNRQVYGNAAVLSISEVFRSGADEPELAFVTIRFCKDQQLRRRSTALSGSTYPCGSIRKPSANSRTLRPGRVQVRPTALCQTNPATLGRPTRSFHVYLHQCISDWDRLRATSPDWTGRCELGRPLQHLTSRPRLACFPGAQPRTA
jgi:hypothetical protein